MACVSSGVNPVKPRLNIQRGRCLLKRNYDRERERKKGSLVAIRDNRTVWSASTEMLEYWIEVMRRTPRAPFRVCRVHFLGSCISKRNDATCRGRKVKVNRGECILYVNSCGLDSLDVRAGRSARVALIEWGLPLTKGCKRYQINIDIANYHIHVCRRCSFFETLQLYWDKIQEQIKITEF